ncbi:menaquinone biosynthetic enzyme MqnA/MqnD family protein [Dendrosporobacter sp. 1207_IL3150]|uniref:menaquinone biosynthetic enzyme MqnA/MqnD family protein n=1 Tax=Dendrosporobacter sp. 1207_IL3150 TaxID=3084054 RepID=UPI002FDA71BD
MEKPSLGHINFINCLPLSYGLKFGGYAEDVEVYPDVPAKLNAKIVGGQLDVSPVSSIVYARNSDKFVLMPNVSISADGALQSILLVSKKPIECLDKTRIALTAKSETSHCLLKIVLHNAYKASPDYYVTDQSLDDGVLNNADAILFIGDDALYNYHNRRDGLYYYDVGDEWKKLTGLPMVYAVWVIKKQFAVDNPMQLQKVYESVIGGFEFGLENLDKAINCFLDKIPFSYDQVNKYLQLLNWKFTNEHEKALLTFYQKAYEIGLIKKVPEIKFAEVAK